MSRNFNKLDRLISYWRLGKIKKYLQANSMVCDFGCGDGDLLKKLNSDLKFKKAIGIDNNAVARNEGSLEFVKIDIKHLNIGPESMDSVLMLAFIEHIEVSDANAVLGEAYRILKPGGRLLVTTPTPLAKSLLEFMAYKLKIISEAEIRDHKHYYSVNELCKMLTEMKFKKIKACHFQMYMNAFYVFEK